MTTRKPGKPRQAGHYSRQTRQHSGNRPQRKAVKIQVAMPTSRYGTVKPQAWLRMPGDKFRIHNKNRVHSSARAR
jgi:hypothetical protein